MPSRNFFSVANMYFNGIRESKILAKISEFTVFSLIVPFIDILMFNVKYLAMEKAQMHAGAISKLNVLYGLASERAIIHSLHLKDNLPLQTYKSCNNLHLPVLVACQFKKNRAILKYGQCLLSF